MLILNQIQQILLDFCSSVFVSYFSHGQNPGSQ